MEESPTIESLQLLVAQKDAIENELIATRSWLVAPGNLGLSGGLVDSEGFPINDVEKIIATREARGKLARLQNDHIDIMTRIEKGLYQLHMKAKAEGNVSAAPKPTPTEPTPTQDELSQKYSHLRAFAFVNSVAQLSPAFKADLRAGDKILKFGTAEHANGGFSKVASNVVENEQVTTVVRRTSEEGVVSIKELSLLPSKWAGPGLLGCHLLPESI